jgi:hypothetical protein|tara:strand:- start:170 stop:544 length:375 start_codon:yes stop_codon:yes gene_type:complete
MKITQSQIRKIIQEEVKAVLNEREGESVEDVVARVMAMPAAFRHSVVNDFYIMADGGGQEFAQYYPHIKDLAAFGKQVVARLKAAEVEDEEDDDDDRFTRDQYEQDARLGLGPYADDYAQIDDD